MGWSCSIRRWCCGRLRVAILGRTHPCRLAGRSLFAPDASTKPHAALAWPNTGADPGKLTTISRPAISLHLRQLALLPFSQLFLILCFTLFFGRLDQSTLISQLLSQLLSSLLSSGSSIYLHPLFNHHARSISFCRPPLVLCSTTTCKKDICWPRTNPRSPCEYRIHTFELPRQRRRCFPLRFRLENSCTHTTVH
jgi:hypothetical protein